MAPAQVDADRHGGQIGNVAHAAVDDNARWHLVLVVEELFTNTVTHGYRGGADAPVEISLACDRGGVTLLYEDAAPPFNPLDLPVTAATGMRARGRRW